ncbi:MAG: leucine-rich repeat protein [Bacteroidaceae bacterium]|nr:leucine-rich repeat protein [Bacteroidaceae bacterium]
MNTQVLLFLGKAALLTVAFVIMYRLLLRRETFHGLKRGALMLSLVLSYVLPLTVITVHRDVRMSPVAESVPITQPVVNASQVELFSPAIEASVPAPVMAETQSITIQAPAVNKDITDILLTCLLAAYLAGLIVMLTLRVISILKVASIVRNGKTVERGSGYKIVVTTKNVSPFSWLGTIVLSEKEYDNIERNVLKHEKAHIAHGHPTELMLLDLMSLFQWFNPAVWVLRRDLCLVHEQQADADVINSVSDARSYQYMLLNQSQGGLAFNIIACFNGNGVESRIDMMNRKRSAKRQILRFLYIPLLMCISLAFTANVTYDMNYAPDQAAQAESENKLLGDQIYPVFNVDGLWFYIENDRAVLCRHTMGERGLAMEQYRGEPELTIPSQIEHEGKTYPVTKIGEMAFGTLWQTEGLKRIAIPSSVTEIGFSAFNSLIGLESIFIPESVVKIGSNLFKECNNLSKIEVAPANTIYDSREGCNAIIETASNTLIMGCMSSVIPGSVTSIADEAFKSCKGLKAIVIPEGVKSIGRSAFEECSGLVSLSIPANFEKIGENAFLNCTGLKSIDTKDGCNALIRANELILGCATTKIPAGVKKIGYRAFYHCHFDSPFVIPAGVEEIGDEAFMGFSGFSDLKIPSTVKVIGKGAFADYDMLLSITVDPANKYFDSREDCNAIIRTKDNTLILGCENTVIPKSIKTIGEKAFSHCKAAKALVLPEGLEHIGREAFAYYTSAAPISLPSSLKTIAPKAFLECKSLASELVISGKVKEIGDSAFQFSYGVETVTIGKGVKIIGASAFQRLDHVKSMVIPEGVKRIGESCFAACDNLETVSLPSSLKYLGGGAFTVSGLREIEIPKSIAEINDGTFTMCMELVKVTLPKTIKRIGNRAFWECRSLEQFQLPEKLEFIGDDAFVENNRFTDIYIPAGVREIGRQPFASIEIKSINVDPRNSRYESPEGSNALIDKSSGTLIAGCSNTVIPKGVKEIGESAFSECWGMERIVIPEGVERIGDNAFRNCRNAEITIPASVKHIGTAAFLNDDESKITNNSTLTIKYRQSMEEMMSGFRF